MDHWRPYLAGSPHKIVIYSDHQNLLYWKEPHNISRRVAREVLMLSEYNFEIHHIKGTANGRADALCYGRLAVVSNVDDGGFALNVDKELRGSAML
jgi:hypothetical protein